MYLFRKNDRLTKALSIMASSCIIVALLVVTKAPSATGYEISIYDAYPWYFWALFILSNVLAICAILQIPAKNIGLWRYPFFILIFNHVLILLLPLIRNYYFFGGGSDSMVHFGDLLLLLKENHISYDNFYPTLIIFSANLQIFVNPSIMHIPLYTNIIFYLVFLLTIPLLAKGISRNQAEFKLLLCLGTILFWWHNFAPFSNSIFFFPIIIYLFYMAQNRVENTLLLLVLSIFMIFLHPLSFFFLLIIFAIGSISNISNKYFRHCPTAKMSSKMMGGLWSILIIGFLISWYLNHNVYNDVFTQIMGKTGGALAPIESYSSILAKARLIDTIKVFFLMYFDIFLLLVCSLFFSIYFIVYRKLKNTFDYVFQFGIFSFLTLAFFLGNFIVGFRPISLAIIFSLFIISLGIGKKYVDKRRIKMLLVMLFLTILIISTFNFYNSPLTKTLNPSLTNMELTGLEWLFKNHVREGGNVYSYERLNKWSRIRTPDQILWSRQPPDRLNFSNEETNEGKLLYFYIPKRTRILYPILHPGYEDYWKYSPSDFKKLENSTSVNKLYVAGEVEVMSIYNY